MERHTVVSLWAEARLYRSALVDSSVWASAWQDDSWAWFIAHVVPWAAERKFANTAILDKEAEQRYWAGPFGLPYRPEDMWYDWRLWCSMFGETQDAWLGYMASYDYQERFCAPGLTARQDRLAERRLREAFYEDRY